MAHRTWQQGFLTAPGIAIALLPKLACPLCWPLYAGMVSSLGFGFLISTTYLLPFTIAFLLLTMAALAYRAKQRRGYGPLGLGLTGSTAVLLGKFYLDTGPMVYTGIAVLVAASLWNVWPKQVAESCGCEISQVK